MSLTNNNEHQRIIVLGGAFSTGKSTMMDQIKHDFGDQFAYILDGGREVLETYGTTPENLSLNELQHVQRAIMAHYLREEKEALRTQKTVISDGSLVEVAAYSQFILEPRDFQRLNAELRYRSYKNLYKYVKFPATTPIEVDGVRHEDEEFRKLIDKRIDRVLEKNTFEVTNIVSDHFCERYAQVLPVLFQDTFHRCGNT